MNRRVLGRKTAVGIAAVLAVVVIALIELTPPAIRVSGSSTTTSEVARQATNLTVKGKEYAFTPSIIKVKMGSVVHITFENTGTITHTLNITGYEVGTGFIFPGETGTVEFVASNPGNFTYFCAVPGHEELGMKGTLVVEGAPSS